MWLLRGCGPKGLGGIPIMREGRIIRPLLHVRRPEILDYLATRALTYRSDSSNAKRIYQRNRIRHDLLPQLQAFNPRFVETLVHTAELLRQEAVLLEEIEQARWSALLIESTPGRVVLDREGFAQTSAALQRRLVRRAWKVVRGTSAGLTYRHVASVLEQFVARTGEASVNLPGGICAGRLRNRVIMEFDHRQPVDDDPPWAAGVPLPVPGSVALGQGWRVRAEVASHSPEAEDVGPDRSSFTMCADVSQTTLIVRRRLPGDWFCPTGMAGRRKKLQDFFVDQKVPRHRRDQVPLVVAPGGIVWVGGYRGDERFRSRSHTSKSVRLFLEEEE
jgi:tRNA(Ile)-lysidine synthase